ncbi:MAG: N-acetylmuramoyl-L-alanine amidase [Candidatus Muirbacterium halophilum]|nr:N-acetylmuramoyl-L-alanine amidase [Candidatus Muirbacterium halophilum]MCK9476641.1 N-acetylmuramoyl-L-alanine amidase [Candidatus Muirbacterium halophilum]
MKKNYLFIFISILLFTVVSANELVNWEYWYGKDFMRFSFMLSDEFEYNIVEMEDERLFVLDIKAEYKDETKFKNIDKGNVESIRIGAFKKDILRVVIKLKFINEVKVYKASKKVNGNHMVFVDVDDYYAGKDIKIDNNIFTVTLDPGHGGFDPGAHNSSLGINEKDLCLDIVWKIKWIFDNIADSRFNIKLTRDDDIYIPLKKRTAISNSYRSNLFLSIHADSSYNKEAYGASFYHYSTESSSKEANWVAYKENNEFIEESVKASDDIDKILGDIMTNRVIRDSSVFSGVIKNVFNENSVKIHGRGVFSADFRVLEDSSCPASLIEVGFISNDDECKKLLSNKYRYDLAKSIVCAIINYYNKVNGKQEEVVVLPEVVVSDKTEELLIDRMLNTFCIKSDYLVFKNKRGNI